MLPDLSKHTRMAFPIASALIKKGYCPRCRKKITKFNDEISEREYEISGLCQFCKDMTFKEYL